MFPFFKLRSLSLIIVMIVFGIFSSQTLADSKKPKIGLVLAGGGAKGLAHVGVIKVLEQAGVKADIVVGTSMGSIIGGLYAMGYGAADLERIVSEIDWNGILQDAPSRTEVPFRRRVDDFGFLTGQRLRIKDGQARLPSGAIAGQKLILELERHTRAANEITDFDDLPIPYRAVAGDIETGEQVVLSAGSLTMAMRASMAVPGVFPPAVLNDRVLVDGFIVNNVPISVAKDLGADIVIVSDFKTPKIDRDSLFSAVGVFGQMVNVLTERSTKQQLALLTNKDILITSDLGEISSASFDRALETIPLGEQAARRNFGALTRLAAHSEEGKSLAEAYKGNQIAAIRFKQGTALDDAVLAERMNSTVGTELDFDKLDRDMSRIYGLGLFETVTYDLERTPDGIDVVVNAKSDSAGKNYFRFGLRLNNNFNGDSTYDFGTSYTVPAINSLNGEWRSTAIVGKTLAFMTDLYQPVDPGARFFVDPNFFVGARNQNLYDNGTRIAEVRVSELKAGLRFGYNIDDALTLGGEVTRGIGSISKKTGTVDIDEGGFDTATVGAALAYDTLDNVKFPKTGALAKASYVYSPEKLGATNQYQASILSASKAITFGHHTLLASQLAVVSWDGAPGEADLFQLGGPFELSGLSSNSLSGTQAFLSRLIYFYELERFNPAFLNLPLYGGFTLEYGDTFQDRSKIDLTDMRFGGNIFLGADTLLGPVYLGAGITEGGNQAIFLSIGDIF